MPSHQDRVRRAYHDITLTETEDPRTNSQHVTIEITKAAIASAMSKRDVQYMIMKLIHEGINRGYR